MIRRWLRSWWLRRTLRCEGCGHRFRRRGDALHSFGGGDRRVYHGPCLALVVWRRKADERLHVLGLAMDLSGLTAADVQTAAELRAESKTQAASAWNEAWRVMRDLEEDETCR